MSRSSQNFWNFSVALYAREGVADSCLDLQNTYGIDINLLLFCCWYGRFHGELPDATLQRAIELSLVWKSKIVQPLRNVRQWMKNHADEFSRVDHSQFSTLRERIKFDELAAERYQQEMLEQIALADLTRNTITPDECVAANIDKLFSATGLENNDFIAIKLNRIIQTL